MKAFLAIAVLALTLNGCALVGLAVMAPGAADTATQDSATNGGVFSQYVWDPACGAVNGTIEPQDGTTGPRNCRAGMR
jgi:hypothetical protein